MSVGIKRNLYVFTGRDVSPTAKQKWEKDSKIPDCFECKTPVIRVEKREDGDNQSPIVVLTPKWMKKKPANSRFPKSPTGIFFHKRCVKGYETQIKPRSSRRKCTQKVFSKISAATSWIIKRPIVTATLVAGIALAYASRATFPTHCCKVDGGVWCSELDITRDTSSALYEKMTGVFKWVHSGSFVQRSYEQVCNATNQFILQNTTKWFSKNPLEGWI